MRTLVAAAAFAKAEILPALDLGPQCGSGAAARVAAERARLADNGKPSLKSETESRLGSALAAIGSTKRAIARADR